MRSHRPPSPPLPSFGFGRLASALLRFVTPSRESFLKDYYEVFVQSVAEADHGSWTLFSPEFEEVELMLGTSRGDLWRGPELPREDFEGEFAFFEHMRELALERQASRGQPIAASSPPSFLSLEDSLLFKGCCTPTSWLSEEEMHEEVNVETIGEDERVSLEARRLGDDSPSPSREKEARAGVGSQAEPSSPSGLLSSLAELRQGHEMLRGTRRIHRGYIKNVVDFRHGHCTGGRWEKPTGLEARPPVVSFPVSADVGESWLTLTEWVTMEKFAVKDAKRRGLVSGETSDAFFSTLIYRHLAELSQVIHRERVLSGSVPFQLAQRFISLTGRMLDHFWIRRRTPDVWTALFTNLEEGFGLRNLYTALELSTSLMTHNPHLGEEELFRFKKELVVVRRAVFIHEYCGAVTMFTDLDNLLSLRALLRLEAQAGDELSPFSLEEWRLVWGFIAGVQFPVLKDVALRAVSSAQLLIKAVVEVEQGRRSASAFPNSARAVEGLEQEGPLLELESLPSTAFLLRVLIELQAAREAKSVAEAEKFAERISALILQLKSFPRSNKESSSPDILELGEGLSLVDELDHIVLQFRFKKLLTGKRRNHNAGVGRLVYPEDGWSSGESTSPLDSGEAVSQGRHDPPKHFLKSTLTPARGWGPRLSSSSSDWGELEDELISEDDRDKRRDSPNGGRSEKPPRHPKQLVSFLKNMADFEARWSFFVKSALLKGVGKRDLGRSPRSTERGDENEKKDQAEKRDTPKRSASDSDLLLSKPVSFCRKAELVSRVTRAKSLSSLPHTGVKEAVDSVGLGRRIRKILGTRSYFGGPTFCEYLVSGECGRWSSPFQGWSSKVGLRRLENVLKAEIMIVRARLSEDFYYIASLVGSSTGPELNDLLFSSSFIYMRRFVWACLSLFAEDPSLFFRGSLVTPQDSEAKFVCQEEIFFDSLMVALDIATSSPMAVGLPPSLVPKFRELLSFFERIKGAKVGKVKATPPSSYPALRALNAFLEAEWRESE